MAIKQLTDEQVKTWSLEEKDRWWLENVWKGDMPQLTLRSAVSGMLIGGVLSMTNLYVGAKTGWTLGVGVTSVILAFAFFKVLSSVNLAKEFTVLENNCMQSIATAAGYMTGPLTSSLAAYMMITGGVLPMPLIYAWIVLLGILGVLFAFPLKKRYINEEQNPFPEGKAAGVVMDALHSGEARDGVFKAAILGVTGFGAALVKLMQSEAVMAKLRAPFFIPEFLDGWLYRLASPRLGGVDLRELTVRPDTDFVMMAAGGLMGIRTGVSLMVGGVLNYLLLAPWMIARGDIVGATAEGVTHYGFSRITLWALWGGVAVMTTSSLYAFFSKPRMILDSFTSMLKKKPGQKDILKDIELPVTLSLVLVPIVGAAVVWMAHVYFGVGVLMGIVAIPLVFVFTLIGAHSTGLTSITPTGALGKLTQLTFSVLSPGNITTNVVTASITAEVAGNASNLLMDIKPGYMLGGKPRHQAVGHVLGIIAGAAVAVPIFYLVFLRGNPAGLISEQYPMPGAAVWKAVAEVLTSGLANLSASARWAALIGAVLGVVLEVARIRSKGRFWLSGVGVGLAFVIPFNTCFAMFLGSFVFWLAGRVLKEPVRTTKNFASAAYRVLVENTEPVCAGVIAGGAIMGIVVTVLEVFVL
ncbi:MAG: OPT/YSL family transporter [Acidobacteriota bacterium]|jgi:OPT family oligopeptide transporter|nr:OPT/YSL family transporter [Acidobacteriota bacterium]